MSQKNGLTMQRINSLKPANDASPYPADFKVWSAERLTHEILALTCATNLPKSVRADSLFLGVLFPSISKPEMIIIL